MQLTIQQKWSLEDAARQHLGVRCDNVSDIVVPVATMDWGFDFHPDYNKIVADVECYTADGCITLFFDTHFQCVAEEFDAYFEAV